MGMPIAVMCATIKRWADLGSIIQGDKEGTTTLLRTSQTIGEWAQLGRKLHLGIAEIAADFDSVMRLIEVTNAWAEAELAQLQGLIDASNKALAPLGDPLLIDFGAHRWLKGDREEAYSDWLAWIVAQLKEPKLVLPIFGIKDTNVLSRCTQARFLPPEREKSVQDGERRLDLVIRYEGTLLIVVEVKVTGADDAYTAKQADYMKWIDEQPEPKPNKYPVLLATEADFQEYDGFRPLRWADLCIKLRKLVPDLYASRPVVAAMILAFAGAVEQNLLGFGCSPMIKGKRGSPKMVDHLRRSLQKEESDGNRTSSERRS
jgi:hypothetical protein